MACAFFSASFTSRSSSLMMEGCRMELRILRFCESSKNQRAQLLPVQRLVLVQDICAKRVYDPFPGKLIGLYKFSRDDISVNDAAAKFREHRRDSAFPTTHATCQTHNEHLNDSRMRITICVCFALPPTYFSTASRSLVDQHHQELVCRRNSWNRIRMNISGNHRLLLRKSSSFLL